MKPQPAPPDRQTEKLWLQGFLGVVELAPTDPRMQRVRPLQAAGLLSAKPEQRADKVVVVVSVTAKGRERLGR